MKHPKVHRYYDRKGRVAARLATHGRLTELGLSQILVLNSSNGQEWYSEETVGEWAPGTIPVPAVFDMDERYVGHEFIDDMLAEDVLMDVPPTINHHGDDFLADFMVSGDAPEEAWTEPSIARLAKSADPGPDFNVGFF